MSADGVLLSELAAAVGGVVAGDGTVRIRGVASLAEAQPGDLSFLGNAKYAAQAATTRATAVLVPADWQGSCPAVLVRVANPDHAFTLAAVRLAPPAPVAPPGVHPTALVASDVRLGPGVSVGPYCVIEAGVTVGARTVLGAHVYIGHACTIGEDCRFYPLVSLRERTTVGHRVIIHNGAVVGSDGFGYAPVDGAWIKIPQVGTVAIGDDVELGANVTVDRARFGKTVIENGVKIDNLVQIAHNVRVGAHTAMAAQVGISGSAVVGKHVQFGGQSGAAGHLTIGDHSVVGAQAGVTKSLPAGSYVIGMPAMPADKFSNVRAHTMRLPELKERLKALEARLAKLETERGAAAGGAA